MSIKQIKLSAQAREQLIRLKTRTGLSQWNILCRWAFCLSLKQPSPPCGSGSHTTSSDHMAATPKNCIWPCSRNVAERTSSERPMTFCCGSFGCTCIAASATWQRRRPYARLPI